MFGMEMMLGGSTNSLTLQNLGGLEPAAVVVRHEYWRLFTALFLHYGSLHLGINLLGLYILGPALERMIGATKFVLSYLLSGLGSSAGVVLLWSLGLTKSNLLVGASGCIMGVIGVSAGLLLRHRQSPLAGRQLQNIIAIVAIQTAFDLWSPQVSLAAHLSGFVSGVAIGLVLRLAKAGARQLFSPLRRGHCTGGRINGILAAGHFAARISPLAKGHALSPCRTFRPITLFQTFPTQLEPLREIVFNLWWTWEPSARRLFRHLDPELWDRTNHNPLRMLQLSRQARLVEVAKDEVFLRDLAEVYGAYKKYLGRKDTYGKKGAGS